MSLKQGQRQKTTTTRRSEPCRLVKVNLLAEEIPTGILHNRTVRAKTILENVLEIVYAYPCECVVTEDTIIDIIETDVYTEVVHEDDKVICFLIRQNGLHRLHVIEQSQWRVLRKALEVFEKGKTVGVLLHGPPGTGKSSFLEVVKGLYGLPTVEVSPEKVFRPLLGHTERTLKALLRKARKLAPCILMFDECDIYFKGIQRTATTIGAVVTGDSAAEVMQRVRNLLLRELQILHKHDAPIIILATTNLPAKFLDPAFRRSGRFDFIVHVPYPSWYMIYTYLRLYMEHIDPEKVKQLLKLHGFTVEQLETFSKILANFGLSMSDVDSMVNELKHVSEVISAKEESSYKRLTTMSAAKVDLSIGSDPLLAPIIRYYEEQLMICPRYVITDDIAKGCDQRIWLLPFLTHLYTTAGVPIIYVTNPQNESTLREAELTAYEMRGVLIINAAATINDIYLAPLTESICPVLIINAREENIKYLGFRNINTLIRDWYKKIIVNAFEKKKIEELADILLDNLRIRTTKEQKKKIIEAFKRIAHVQMITETKDFAVTIEELVRAIYSIIEQRSQVFQIPTLEKEEKRRGFTQVVI